jgi:hypothetical protein
MINVKFTWSATLQFIECGSYKGRKGEELEALAVNDSGASLVVLLL